MLKHKMLNLQPTSTAINSQPQGGALKLLECARAVHVIICKTVYQDFAESPSLHPVRADGMNIQMEETD